MGDILKLIWWAVTGLFQSKASLEAEILTLRHQLNVLRRKSPKRLSFSSIDRLIFAGQRARLIFPALEGYHRAHLGWLFNDLRHTNDTEEKGFIKRPTLIQDRFGVEVYSNESWNQATDADSSIMSAVAALFADSSPQTRFLKDFVLRSEVFDRDFPLAPAGKMFVLEPQPLSQHEPDHRNRIANLLRIFTPREREILTLIMGGQNTGQIAQKLQISKGTIKNCRLRIYRKADVVSERALVKKFTTEFSAP